MTNNASQIAGNGEEYDGATEHFFKQSYSAGHLPKGTIVTLFKRSANFFTNNAS